jgi:hypothetical protein
MILNPIKKKPRFGEDCLTLIFKQGLYKNYSGSLKKEIDDLYAKLNLILHNRKNISNQSFYSNAENNFFNENTLKEAIILYNQTTKLIAIMLLLGNYPDFNKNHFNFQRYNEIKNQINK